MSWRLVVYRVRLDSRVIIALVGGGTSTIQLYLLTTTGTAVATDTNVTDTADFHISV